MSNIAVLRPSAGEISLPVYDTMCHAIAECHRVDEIKDLHDKALALEMYARQAHNTQSERLAIEVRIRAERRCGELLKDLERSPTSKGGDTGGNQYISKVPASTRLKPPKSDEPGFPQEKPAKSPYAQALEDNDLTHETANKWQKLADIPEERFEDVLKDPDVKPSTKGIIRQEAERKTTGQTITIPDRKQEDSLKREINQIPKAALNFWGWLKDFENDGYDKINTLLLLDGMTDVMREETIRLISVVADHFASLKNEVSR